MLSAALLSTALLSLAPQRALAQLHGYVEPCTVEFVQDGTTICEGCVPSATDPELCERNLGSQGYQRKCRTGGHSATGEVWCRPKGSAPTNAGFAQLAGAVACVLLVSGAFFWFRRKRQRG